MGNLHKEFANAFENIGPRQFDWLRGHGVSDQTLFGGPQIIGIDRIVTDGEFFQPDPSGEMAFIMPVADRYRFGTSLEVDDLVAWQPTTPAHFWVRYGGVSMMNRFALEDAGLDGVPLRVHGSPLAWMKAELDGCVPLVPLPQVVPELHGLPKLLCSSKEFARILDMAFAYPFGRPEVRLGEALHAAA